MLVVPVRLADGVGAWFTGRDRTCPDPEIGSAGNLSHRRPHLPSVLARDRARACVQMGFAPGSLHLMHQAHGASVGVVAAGTPPGAELRGVDALVTSEPERPLAVQVADCVPLLLAGDGVVAAVHVGRRGLAAGVVQSALGALDDLVPGVEIRAAIGPAIGGCCYEVPVSLRDEVGEEHPAAVAETTWGAPSLDLRAGVERLLARFGATVINRSDDCTRCDRDQRWFSHRADPRAGRQLGVVVLRHSGGAAGAGERAA